MAVSLGAPELVGLGTIGAFPVEPPLAMGVTSGTSAVGVSHVASMVSGVLGGDSLPARSTPRTSTLAPGVTAVSVVSDEEPQSTKISPYWSKSSSST
jgi:hypothetical protein